MPCRGTSDFLGVEAEPDAVEQPRPRVATAAIGVRAGDGRPGQLDDRRSRLLRREGQRF